MISSILSSYKDDVWWCDVQSYIIFVPVNNIKFETLKDMLLSELTEVEKPKF